MESRPLTAMVVPDPPPLPQSVGEILGAGQLPDDLVAALADRFRTCNEEGGGGITTERRTEQGLHSLLIHLESGFIPVPGIERLCLLRVD